jgi:hypothetical protein
MMIKTILRFSVAVACFVSSTVALDSGSALGEIKEVNSPMPQQLLRGNQTGLDVAQRLHEAIDHEYDYDEMIYKIYNDLEDEEFGVDLSNATADESGRRQLAMSNRDRQWLNSHNIRRKRYHSKYNNKYVPLRWSPKLKRSSKQWATHLANICGSKGIYHDPQNPYGENLASNWGTGKWADKPSTDSVLTRLVEKEERLGYPQNGHFTQVRDELLMIFVSHYRACSCLFCLCSSIIRQVLWRATKFVGCAEHTKIFRDGSGKRCHVQVCRYAK